MDASSPARGQRPGARAVCGGTRGWVSVGTRQVLCPDTWVRQAAGTGALSRGSAKRGAEYSSPKAGRLETDTPGLWRKSFLLLPPLPRTLVPSAPWGDLRPPHFTPLIHLPEGKMEAPGGVGSHHASGRRTSLTHPDAPTPRSRPELCHVTTPGTTGTGNKVYFLFRCCALGLAHCCPK